MACEEHRGGARPRRMRVLTLPLALAACGDDDDGGGEARARRRRGHAAAGAQLHRDPAAAPLRRPGDRRRGRRGRRRADGRDLPRPASSAATPTGSRRSSPATSTWTSRAPPRSVPSTSRSACWTRRTRSTTATTWPGSSTTTPPTTAPGLRGGDRRAHPRRLVGRHAAVHRERADPQPGGPRRPADAVPELAAVPDERRGARRRGDRGGLRGAVPRPAAGHGRRPGEPDRQHRRQQPRRRCRTTSACPPTRPTPTS